MDPSTMDKYTGPMLQNVTDNDIVALVIELGGHHTDLMYSDPRDPMCVIQARAIERDFIAKWIDDWSAR
jgi:hypothetical protein